MFTTHCKSESIRITSHNILDIYKITLYKTHTANSYKMVYPHRRCLNTHTAKMVPFYLVEDETKTTTTSKIIKKKKQVSLYLYTFVCFRLWHLNLAAFIFIHLQSKSEMWMDDRGWFGMVLHTFLCNIFLSSFFFFAFYLLFLIWLHL